MRIRFTEILLAVILFMALPGIALSQRYSGGSGTSSDPYQIATKADLDSLCANSGDWGDYFIQTANIAFTSSDFQSGGSFYNGGAGFIPIGNGTTNFTGSYNGQGYDIDGLYINSSSTAVGMFGVLYGSATISSLVLTNVNITCSASSAPDIGALVGVLGDGANYAVVQDCYASGSVSGQYGGDLGGLVGFLATRATVSQSASACSASDGSFGGQEGGLVGFAEGNIENSYSVGNVGGPDLAYAGGLVGTAYGCVITDCYSTGSVATASSGYGGLVGSNTSSTANSPFWDINTSGLSTSPLGAGKTTAQMQTKSTFTDAGWNFTSIWQIIISGYPTLRAFSHFPGLPRTKTYAATSIKDSSATLHGTVNPIGDTLAVRFLYGTTSGSYSDSISAVLNNVSGDTAVIDSASATGLSSSTTYYYRIASSNGTAYYLGSEMSFTTPAPSGQSNYALQYSGSNQYAAGTATVSGDTNNVTLEAWVNWGGDDGHSQLIAWVGSGPNANGYGILVLDGGGVTDKIAILAGAVGWGASGYTLPTGVWSHVAAVRDNGIWSLYLNGKSVNIDSISGFSLTNQSPITPSNIFAVGDDQSGQTTSPFKGDIDEVLLSDTARYTSNFTPLTVPSTPDSHTVALYHFDKGTGSTAYDSSGNGYDMTVYNSPIWVTGVAPSQVTEATGAATASASFAGLNGTINPYDDTLAVRFLYGTTSNSYTDSVNAAPDTVSGNTTTAVSASVGNLSANTIYYYRLVATNGSKYYRGFERTFSTAGAQSNYALQFNGSNQYASGPATVSGLTNNVTLEAWVDWGGDDGHSQLIAYVGSGPNANGYGILVLDGGGVTDKIAVLVGIVRWGASGYTLPTGVWTHLAAVRDNGIWSLYVNGKSVNIDSVSGYNLYNQSPVTPSDSFSLGDDQSGQYTSPFDGEIDEVRLSDTVRYTSNFTPQTAQFTPDSHTVALYHLNEGAGSTAYDASGNAYNLTLHNSPAWAVASDVSLAVQATDFLATSSAGSVTLTWETQSEVNNAGFEILRQVQGERNTEKGAASWQLISSYTTNDSLVGMGTSSAGRSYDFTDYHVTSGVTYNYKIESVSTKGATKELSTLTVTVGVPKTYALYQNYPNPFNPTTTIRFDLKEQSNVTLAIYNVLGQEVESWNYGAMNAGRYNKDVNMARFASGMYFYRIMAKGLKGDRFVSIKKMLMIK